MYKTKILVQRSLTRKGKVPKIRQIFYKLENNMTPNFRIVLYVQVKKNNNDLLDDDPNCMYYYLNNNIITEVVESIRKCII